MADGNEWNPDDYDPDAPLQERDYETDHAWQAKNNQIMVAWAAWHESLEAYARRKGGLSREHRAYLTEKFRDKLRDEYGQTEPERQWLSMKEERIRLREARERRGR